MASIAVSNFSSSCSNRIPANRREESCKRDKGVHATPVHQTNAWFPRTCQHEEDAEAGKTHVAVDEAGVLHVIKVAQTVTDRGENICPRRCT